ncbi:MAG: polysaccharide deacetylase family protein [Chitinophagaceae bacterium]
MPHLFNTIHLFKSRLKGLPKDIGASLGLHRSFFTKEKGSRILVYHGVCRKDHLKFNTLFVTAKAFEKQLRLYKKYCSVISLEDHYEQRFSKDRFNVCLSFDDGFANNYQYVLPLLEQYEVPAVFFVTGIRESGHDILWNDVLAIAYKYGPQQFTFRNEKYIKRRDGKYIDAVSGVLLSDRLRTTGFAEKEEMIALLGLYKERADEEYWLQQTREQLRELSSSKWVTIGSHSQYHNDLAKLPAAVAQEDMIRSKHFLESITGKEIKAIAFPYGSYNPETINAAKAAGFSQLLATEFLFPEDGSDTTLRERLTINPFISGVNQLYATISGSYT